MLPSEKTKQKDNNADLKRRENIQLKEEVMAKFEATCEKVLVSTKSFSEDFLEDFKRELAPIELP